MRLGQTVVAACAALIMLGVASEASAISLLGFQKAIMTGEFECTTNFGDDELTFDVNGTKAYGGPLELRAEGLGDLDLTECDNRLAGVRNILDSSYCVYAQFVGDDGREIAFMCAAKASKLLEITRDLAQAFQQAANPI